MNETTGFTVRLAKDEKEALRSAAKQQGITMSMLFRMLLHRYLLAVDPSISTDPLEIRHSWLFRGKDIP